MEELADIVIPKIRDHGQLSMIKLPIWDPLDPWYT